MALPQTFIFAYGPDVSVTGRPRSAFSKTTFQYTTPLPFDSYSLVLNMALSAMHLFSSLPAEIRLEIWQYSCPQRVVEVTYNAEQGRCTTTTPLPSVLNTCSESRNEALRIYKRLFSTKTHEGILFCPSIDVLYLPRPAKMGYDNSSRDFASLVSGAHEVENLALDHVNPITRRPWETYNKYVLMQSFPQVKEVFLILDSESKHEPEGIAHGFVQLADPGCDNASVCKLLADVKESFTFELGADFEVSKCEDGQPKSPEIVLKSMVTKEFLRLL